MFAELITLLAILNATLVPNTQIQLPYQVTTTQPVQPIQQQSPVQQQEFQGSASETATPAPAPTNASFTIDIATITAVIGMVGGVIAMFKKTIGNTDNRLNAVADTITGVAQSMKSTDYGSKDNADLLARLAQAVQFKDEAAVAEITNLISTNAQQWNTDVKQYYENTPVAPRPGELENDSMKKKLAKVNRITEKTEIDS